MQQTPKVFTNEEQSDNTLRTPTHIGNCKRLMTKFKSMVTKNNDPNFSKRIMIFAVIFASILINRIFNLSSTSATGCMADYIHSITQYFNYLVNTSTDWRVAFQISSAVLMDFVFFMVFIVWLRNASNCRLFVSMVFFYASRAIFQNILKLGFPEGYLWSYPGISSVVVGYGKFSDFFFSGHAGFLLIAALELKANGFKKAYRVTVAILIYMIFVLLIFRIHYAVDITAGVLYAAWSFKIVCRNLDMLNRFWINFYIELCSLCVTISKKLRCKTRQKSFISNIEAL